MNYIVAYNDPTGCKEKDFKWNVCLATRFFEKMVADPKNKAVLIQLYKTNPYNEENEPEIIRIWQKGT